MSAIDFGRPTRVVRLFDGRLTFRLDMKVTGLVALMVAIALVLTLLTLASGEYQVPLGEVLGALLGQAEGRVHMVVVEWRLPRALLALVFGAALGMSGAIFQSLTRNPLGSPDVIGFNAGAYSGALIVIIGFSGNYYQIAGGALAGGIATALAVYGLAWRQGVQGFRLIIVGIGLSAMLTSLNTWLMLRADLEVAMTAAVWGAGSLNGLGLDKFWPSLIVLALIVPLVLMLERPMKQLEMGDDAARALGTRVELVRLSLLVLGVALTATATAVAGPIAFVSLAAPQIARRITGAAGVALIPSAAVGAVLLVAADFLAQRAFAPTQLPVGVVTVCIGGIYFVWLLVREAQRQ
ncbi:iron-enterobactin ABC transporter permease [Pelagibacterium luteolum]|uniref:Iron complex transport system permease protein n=1 Tax=Pelagibacterium luteolum TaxID=440168 RepID=A0A1G7WDX0_9HYPH|nr:iron-enterobactin ABC transporter permease [Pelagibacterium luteolum]SDG70172.1 iron complex transport system permease protein [Pelagibacterium luteolum]